MANEIIYGLITFELYLYGVFACAIVLTAKLTFIYMILIDAFCCWPLCVCVEVQHTHKKSSKKPVCCCMGCYFICARIRAPKTESEIHLIVG